MGYFLLGVLILAALVGAAYAISRARPQTLVSIVRYGAGALLLAGGGLLTARGSVALGVPLALVGIGAITRGRIGNFSLGGARRSPGQASSVASAYIAMRLDHDTGAMEGEVLAGTFAGRNLADLDESELRALLVEAAADPDSVALLEAYLDRRIPGWREDLKDDPAGGPAGAADAGAMTDEQAYEILGLAPGASDAEIRAAHRHLMKGVHPDQGGSTFLAVQINQAKDRLLGKHR